jgi:hypothetical protein
LIYNIGGVPMFTLSFVMLLFGLALLFPGIITLIKHRKDDLANKRDFKEPTAKNTSKITKNINAAFAKPEIAMTIDIPVPSEEGEMPTPNQ